MVKYLLCLLLYAELMRRSQEFGVDIFGIFLYFKTQFQLKARGLFLTTFHFAIPSCNCLSKSHSLPQKVLVFLASTLIG